MRGNVFEGEVLPESLPATILVVVVFLHTRNKVRGNSTFYRVRVLACLHTMRQALLSDFCPVSRRNGSRLFLAIIG